MQALIGFARWIPVYPVRWAGKGLFLPVAVLMGFAVILGAYGVGAQPIVLRPDDVLPALQNPMENDDGQENKDKAVLFYINGPTVHGLSADDANRFFHMGRLARLSLSFVALRLADRGALDLDTALHHILPELVEDPAFTIVPKVVHLLSETGGYAVPPWYSKDWNAADRLQPTQRLRPYVMRLRRAGQMPHDDPVGWALLAMVLEQASSRSLRDLITAELLRPLGYDSEAISWPGDESENTLFTLPSAFQPVLSFEAKGAVLADIARLVVRNRLPGGGRYLTPESHSLLANRVLWHMHPMASVRTAGLIADKRHGRTRLSLPGPVCGTDSSLIAYPAAELVFVHLSMTGWHQATDCRISRLWHRTTEAIAEHYIPPQNPSRQMEAARKLVPPQNLSGFYVRDDAPTAWLKLRLNRIREATVFVADHGASGLEIRRNGSVRRFDPAAPYHFTDKDGGTLTFSQAHGRGYFVMDGHLYRHVGVLGDERLVLAPFPWVLLILLTSVFYWRHPKKPWRRMGRFGATGTAMFGAGLLMELHFWPYALLLQDEPLAVLGWRLLLNGGLMLILTLPMFALSFARKGEMPAGIGIFLGPLHLTLLTAAALVLFLLTVAWGLAGTFWPL